MLFYVGYLSQTLWLSIDCQRSIWTPIKFINMKYGQVVQSLFIYSELYLWWDKCCLWYTCAQLINCPWEWGSTFYICDLTLSGLLDRLWHMHIYITISYRPTGFWQCIQYRTYNRRAVTSFLRKYKNNDSHAIHVHIHYTLPNPVQLMLAFALHSWHTCI